MPITGTCATDRCAECHLCHLIIKTHTHHKHRIKLTDTIPKARAKSFLSRTPKKPSTIQTYIRTSLPGQTRTSKLSTEVFANFGLGIVLETWTLGRKILVLETGYNSEQPYQEHSEFENPPLSASVGLLLNPF